jgi:hypothetical protein
VRTRSIDPGDIVLCCKQGRVFYAVVLGHGVGGILNVRPLERGIAYRQVSASEISDHWAHTASTRRADRPARGQIGLDFEKPTPR